ncbi:hypothetical protein G7Y89_g6239 [Cudoniella acicularis]|uniref:Uncharacterized protein n=1 Tax=Cudoniella acicularis TaxID=354080 RepID=A0A8H4RKV3_9HELO|nr:hypothetical protein G7Y89_g6239 [Cudoniella acicularis]
MGWFDRPQRMIGISEATYRRRKGKSNEVKLVEDGICLLIAIPDRILSCDLISNGIESKIEIEKDKMLHEGSEKEEVKLRYRRVVSLGQSTTSLALPDYNVLLSRSISISREGILLSLGSVKQILVECYLIAKREELLQTVSETTAEGQEPGRNAGEGPAQLSFEDSVLNTHQSALKPMSRESRLLNVAFGGNALAHYEWRIDLVTWLSVAAIALKILAISGAGWFRAACFLLMVGWAAVQILLSLFHTREMGDEDKRAAVRLAQDVLF